MDNFDMQRRELEKMYNGRCWVYEYGKVKDDITKLTSAKETEVLSDIPCRVSFSKIQPTEGTSGAAGLSAGIKLFLSPEIEVKPGSKIKVIQDGHTDFYASSGKAAIYPTHQEIMIELFERWA